MRTPIALLLLFCVAVPLLGITEIELARARIGGLYTTGEPYHLPPARVMRGLAFGFNETLSDLLWVRSIAYFADHLTTDRDFTHLQRYLKAILTLDAHFRAVYRYGSAMLMSRGERQTNDDVFAAIDLLERGHRLYPDEHHFPMLLGTYYLTELRPDSDDQKKRWRRQAADWIHRAALIGSDSPWLATLAAKIYTEQGQRELAIRHLKELYVISADDKTKGQIAAKLKELQHEQIAQLRQQARSFSAEHEKGALRFVPADLYALVRHQPMARFALD